MLFKPIKQTLVSLGKSGVIVSLVLLFSKMLKHIKKIILLIGDVAPLIGLLLLYIYTRNGYQELTGIGDAELPNKIYILASSIIMLCWIYEVVTRINVEKRYGLKAVIK